MQLPFSFQFLANLHLILCQAYGRLCKCLGEDFLPYLILAMPIVLKSAQPSVSNSSDTDDSDDERLDLPITTCTKFNLHGWCRYQYYVKM